jgi:hypothetical protein
MEEKNGELEEQTLEQVYQKIDEKVHAFIKEFIDFLPTTADVTINMNLVVDKLLSVKESAKLLVNNYAQNIALKEQSKDKDNKDG